MEIRIADGAGSARLPDMKVTIVGPGKVGMILAYTLVMRGSAREIVLVGNSRLKAEGEALDLMHAQAFMKIPVKVRAGDLEDAAGSEIIAICASVPMEEGFNDRNALAQGNAEMMARMLPMLAGFAPEAKLLMVSNPVDVLSYLALRFTGFPPEHVMGTGTLVDSMRFRELLSSKVSIHPGDLRAYIFGEHGAHQFPAMSVAQAGGEKLDDTPERRALCDVAKEAGIEVFRKKGNTCYAIGQSAAYVIESILLDQKRTIPLSVMIDGYLGVSDVYLSVPVVIGRNGIERKLVPQLSEMETEQFRLAAKSVRAVIDSVL